jgi:hypothetical protein
LAAFPRLRTHLTFVVSEAWNYCVCSFGPKSGRNSALVLQERALVCAALFIRKVLMLFKEIHYLRKQNYLVDSRAAWEMRHQNHMTYRQIAEALGVPDVAESTIGRSIQRYEQEVSPQNS